MCAMFFERIIANHHVRQLNPVIYQLDGMIDTSTHLLVLMGIIRHVDAHQFFEEICNQVCNGNEWEVFGVTIFTLLFVIV